MLYYNNFDNEILKAIQWMENSRDMFDFLTNTKDKTITSKSDNFYIDFCNGGCRTGDLYIRLGNSRTFSLVNIGDYVVELKPNYFTVLSEEVFNINFEKLEQNKLKITDIKRKYEENYTNYRHKENGDIIEAIQWRKKNLVDMYEFLSNKKDKSIVNGKDYYGKNFYIYFYNNAINDGNLHVKTGNKRETFDKVNVGDYIIKIPNTDYFYIQDEEEFNCRFEPIIKNPKGERTMNNNLVEKDLEISEIKQAKENISDLKVYGDGDTFALLCKASSQQQGWMKSTKVCNLPNGCIVQVTTQQKNPDGSYSCAEALTFVPDINMDTSVEPRVLKRIALI